MELQQVLEQYAGIVLDRQHVFGEMLGAHDWAADMETGLFYCNGPHIESPFEVIGTVSSHTGEWLWGWANASLPGDLAVISGKLRDLGLARGIGRLTQDRFPLKGNSDLHAFGIAACGMGGATAYYIADHGDGILLAALTGESFLRGWRPDHARVFTVFPRLLQLFEVDHRAALQHYLTALGYALREENGLLASRDGNVLTAEFDAMGRLSGLKDGLAG